MRNAVALALTAMFVTAHAYAADPQQQRQETMKGVGQSMGMLGKTAKGEIEFDAEAVKTAFANMNTAAKAFADQFPEGSESGHNTEASPKIWSDREGFDNAVKQFQTDTAEAVSAAPQDLDSFKASFGKVARNCGTCHETYRVKTN
ncbi:MAG: cytochrome c [Pseudomonadota bacterium]